jgi:nucleoside 2-deoxyribosyltransferase
MSNISPEEASKWRKKAKHLLDVFEINSIDPTYFYNFDLAPPTYTDKEVMEFDLAAVLCSDLILINLDFPDSVGTSVEAFYAYRILNKPVLGFGKNSNIHPWLQACLVKQFETLESIIEYIASYYKPIFE